MPRPDPFAIPPEEIYRRAAAERARRTAAEWDSILNRWVVEWEPIRPSRGYRVTPGGRRPLIEWQGRIIG